MADTKISALPAASALDGTEPAPVVQGGVTKKALASQLGTYVRGLFTATPATIAEGGTGAATAATARTALAVPGEAPSNGAPYMRNSAAWQRTFVSPGYVSGNWYPADYGLSVTAGATYSTGQVWFSPLVIYQDVTITDLAVEITTAVAASNVQLAVYAADATTKRPIGAPLTTTASMSGATATTISSTLASPLFLAAGLYWLGVASDAAIACRALGATQGWVNAYVGSSTLANILKSNPAQLNFRQSGQTFGTWTTVTTVAEGNFNAQQTYISAYKAQ